MPNWKGPRYDAGWVYRRVAWGTWMEVGEYSNIESLSYSKSALNSLKLSGSASCDGDPPDEIDAVTAYYTFADGSGEVALVPVRRTAVFGIGRRYREKQLSQVLFAAEGPVRHRAGRLLDDTSRDERRCQGQGYSRERRSSDEQSVVDVRDERG